MKTLQTDKTFKILSITVYLPMFLCAVMCFLLLGVPVIKKWRDETYFFNHQEQFEQLVNLAEQYSGCETSICYEPLPEFVQLGFNHGSRSHWLLCHSNKLDFFALSTPSDNYYVYSPDPDFPNSPTCGSRLLGLDRLDGHWFFSTGFGATGPCFFVCEIKEQVMSAPG